MSSSSSSSASGILILRTVSVEKLDGILSACCDRWPSARLAVLTNPGRSAELALDARISEVLSVPLGPGGFDGNLRIQHETFDAVVVPVGNRGGFGYANVIRAALNCPAREYFLASYARDLRVMSRRRLRLSVAGESLMLAVNFPPAWLLARLHRW